MIQVHLHNMQSSHKPAGNKTGSKAGPYRPGSKTDSSFISFIWDKHRQRWRRHLFTRSSLHIRNSEKMLVLPAGPADKTLPEEGQESSMGKTEWTYDIVIHQDRSIPTERSESAVHLLEIVVFNNHWTCGHITSISSFGRQNAPKINQRCFGTGC